MKSKEKVLLCWSGGKDSALALHAIRKQDKFEITGLLTTLSEEYGRVSMHGVRRDLTEAQAKSIGAPLQIVSIPADCSNEVYESRMREMLERQKAGGVSAVVFGDVFLQDVRKHRESKLTEIGMRAIFPLWERDTRELASEFIRAGFRAILTCVDSQMLDGSFAGREFDEQLLRDFPAGVDPCGENGEFHTFVYAGPIFRSPIRHRIGEVVIRRERFHFCDLM
ncbi:MAG: Dph6-related ATP pyrophosphatase [Planctomycetota bacterium]|jgi:uncharacterized protein (TIGR00290 family)